MLLAERPEPSIRQKASGIPSRLVFLHPRSPILVRLDPNHRYLSEIAERSGQILSLQTACFLVLNKAVVRRAHGRGQNRRLEMMNAGETDVDNLAVTHPNRPALLVELCREPFSLPFCTFADLQQKDLTIESTR